METSAIRELCRGYLAGTLTAPELRQFLDYLREDSNHEIFMEEMHMALQQEQYAHRVDDGKVDLMLQNVLLRARPRRRRMFLRYAAAAAVLAILLGTGAYFWFQGRPSKSLIVSGYGIAPGSNKAILTLADGSTVALDSAGNQVIQQGNTAVHQQGGVLQYNVRGAEAMISYNTLTTPRGGQFQIRLPDGTKVWLNAASSLRYPTAFIEKERVVEVTGEVYFEVEGSADKPFKVKIGEQAAVEVLGTSFNINAYTDETVIKTTLLEGKVKVIKDLEVAVLSPGEQAQMGYSAKIKVEKNADIDQALAWKNGLFNFNDANLQGVMRQIARWYDIEVIYEKGVPDIEFVGKMSRNEKLSDLLRGFERFDIHFRLEDGRRLIVTP